MGFYLEYFCDMKRDCTGNCEGHQGRTRGEVYSAMRANGWKRIKGRGWACPQCVEEMGL